jgi:SAM-dependent methyltransferase
MLDYDPLAGYHDPQAYDLEDGDYVADQPLTDQRARTLSSPILDIACGTGTMAIHLAQQGYHVTGIDIIPVMIDWSAQKAAAAGVTIDWQVGDARAFHLGKQFAFIYMIGNAFQHLLTRADHEGLFDCVREHLTTDGCFLFNTRNPSPRNLLQTRYPEPKTFTDTDGRHMTISETQHYDPMTQLQHYTFHNQWRYPDGRHEEKIERTALRYVFPQEMEALLHYNGLEIRAVYGSWEQEPFTADSRSMIYVCQKRLE